MTNASERIYQYAFCQTLALSGKEVIHLTNHGVNENGKDVIARDADGALYAYQLKAGKITGAVFESIIGELNSLAMLPIRYPGIPDTLDFKSVLVTTGDLTEDARAKCNDLNSSLRLRGFGEVSVLSGRLLLKQFVDTAGRFLPTEPADMLKFLHLYTSDGRDILPTDELAEFVTTLLTPKKELSKKGKVELLGRSYLFVNYALKPWLEHKNYCAMALADAVFIATANWYLRAQDITCSQAGQPIELAKLQLMENLSNLKTEVLGKEYLLEGTVGCDGGLIYCTRVSLLFGWLSAYELISLWLGQTSEVDSRVIELFKENFPNNIAIPSEALVPPLIAVTLLLLSAHEHDLAIELLSYITRTVVNASAEEDGIPSPYFDIQDCILYNYGLPVEGLSEYSHTKSAYTAKALSAMMVALNLKYELVSLWQTLTHIISPEFLPRPEYNFFLFRSEKGDEHMYRFASGQSFSALREAYKEKKFAINGISVEVDLLLLCCLAYPYRFTTDVALTLLDYTLSQTAGSQAS